MRQLFLNFTKKKRGRVKKKNNGLMMGLLAVSFLSKPAERGLVEGHVDDQQDVQLPKKHEVGRKSGRWSFLNFLRNKFRKQLVKKPSGTVAQSTNQDAPLMIFGDQVAMGNEELGLTEKDKMAIKKEESHRSFLSFNRSSHSEPNLSPEQQKLIKEKIEAKERIMKGFSSDAERELFNKVLESYTDTETLDSDGQIERMRRIKETEEYIMKYLVLSYEGMMTMRAHSRDYSEQNEMTLVRDLKDSHLNAENLEIGINERFYEKNQGHNQGLSEEKTKEFYGDYKDKIIKILLGDEKAKISTTIMDKIRNDAADKIGKIEIADQKKIAIKRKEFIKEKQKTDKADKEKAVQIEKLIKKATEEKAKKKEDFIKGKLKHGSYYDEETNTFYYNSRYYDPQGVYNTYHGNSTVKVIKGDHNPLYD